MKTITILFLCAFLAACQSTSNLKNEVEMPYNDNPESIDIERKSPCACVEYSSSINQG